MLREISDSIQISRLTETEPDRFVRKADQSGVGENKPLVRSSGSANSYKVHGASFHVTKRLN